MSTTINSIADLQDVLSGERTAMITTVDERGTLSSRPVSIQRIDDEGDPWFLVDKNADWVPPADGSPINAAVVDEGSAWVSFAGRATLVTDDAVVGAMLSAVNELFFEEGAEPVALRVVSDRIEWWTAPNKIAQAFELAKAKVTGGTADMGDSGTLEV